MTAQAFRYALLIVLATSAACHKRGKRGGKAKAPEQTAAADMEKKPNFVVPVVLDEVRALFARGEYAIAQTKLTDALNGLPAEDKPEVQFQRGVLQAWVAIIHSQTVPEQGEAALQEARTISETLQEPTLAKHTARAQASYLSATEQYESAFEILIAATVHETKASYSLMDEDAAIDALITAQSLIGQAFGGGDSNELRKPDALNNAQATYELLTALAPKTAQQEAWLGRAHEGLAAIAKYQGRTADICAHVQAALTHYKNGQASALLLEGPQTMAVDHNCKK